MPINNINLARRDFVKLSAMAGAAIPLMGFDKVLPHSIYPNKDNLEVHLFSKHLQFLDYNEMSEATAEMGFAGLDLTVRPEGHVSPSSVMDDLPKAVAAMKNYGLSPRMITTNVIDPKIQKDLSILETASKVGVTHYRTAWLSYPENRDISESQAIYGQLFKKLELLNEQLGLIGCYQNHAGNHVGAPIWDLQPILEVTRNAHFGCQYDIRHAVVEGSSCWELGLRMIKPYIKSLVIKDFKWGTVNGKWKPINTPLGEGMVDFDRYFSLLKKYQINVPVSLHLEYDLGGAEHGATKITMNKRDVFRQMKKDLTFLDAAWKRAK